MYSSCTVPSNNSGPAGCVGLKSTQFNEASDDWFARRPSVLSVDEKSQIQALDRFQPGVPMKPGRAGTMTHDYKRHGTTTLFAALNILDGTVIGRNMQRHRHQEFIRFLNTDAKNRVWILPV